jgi:hypothetical protein
MSNNRLSDPSERTVKIPVRFKDEAIGELIVDTSIREVVLSF